MGVGDKPVDMIKRFWTICVSFVVTRSCDVAVLLGRENLFLLSFKHCGLKTSDVTSLKRNQQ